MCAGRCGAYENAYNCSIEFGLLRQREMDDDGDTTGDSETEYDWMNDAEKEAKIFAEFWVIN